MSELRRIGICSLYSGSKGNSTLVRCGDDAILIDAGKSARALCRALNDAECDPESIKAIFVTHEHSDHISAIPVFASKYHIPVHIAEGSVDKLLSNGGSELLDLLVIHKQEFEESVGENIKVRSFPTSHDSEMSVGYHIECDLGGEKAYKIGFATDIGYVSDDVVGGLAYCDSVILESNHDPDMLLCGRYPYELKRRIASKRGHLSNHDCAAFASFLAGKGTENIMLAHLSEENNLPDLAYAEVRGAVADDRVNIVIASPREVVKLV